MGLFNFGKKKKAEEAKTAEQRFHDDITALLERDDIQCRDDVCQAEYQKAMRLLENPTAEKVHEAYDIIGHLAAEFEYTPAMMWMGDFAENAMQQPEKAVYWYKRAAERGDGNGARCYADMLMVGKGVERNQRQAMHYYAEAADKGVPEAAFVLGEFLRSGGDRENALKAYQQAYDAGYEPAGFRIQQMKNGQR